MTVMAVDTRWAGTPLDRPHWLEGDTGFPAGGIADTGLGPDTEILATARQASLTRRQVDEVVAFAELLAGRALPGSDREQLSEDLVDAFEDSPVQTIGFLRPLTGGVARLATMGPVERAVRRLQALTTTWTLEQRRLVDGADLNPVLEVVHRHNPLVRHWASTGVVLVADLLTARADQHRLVLSLIGVAAQEERALIERLLARVDAAGPAEIAELAAAQVRLLCIRIWLRDLGETALGHLIADLTRAVPSALDVDIVVEQVAFRASLAVAASVGSQGQQRRRR